MMNDYIRYSILEFLTTEELKDIPYSPLYSNYIYYRCASDNVRLVNNKYLVEADFRPTYNLLDTPNRTILDKILQSKYFVIAGGFATQLYLERLPQVVSDIDVFVLGGSDKERQKEATKDFEAFLKTFDFDYEIEPVGFSECVFNIVSPVIPYKIQFIFTEYSSICEVLTSFDNSHNRCGMHLNKCYLGPDAVLSKSTMTTYFYQQKSIRRYKKARDLSFYINNFSERQNIELLNDKYKVEKIKSKRELIPRINKPIHYISTWLNAYDNDHKENEFNKPIEIDVKDFKRLQGQLEVKFDNNNLTIYLLKETDIYGLKLKTPVKLITNLELKRLNWMRCLAKTNKLKIIKNLLVDITSKAHGLTNVPKKILEESKDLIGQEAFKELCKKEKDRIIKIIRKSKQTNRRDSIIRLLDELDITNGLLDYFGHEYMDSIILGQDKNSIIRISLKEKHNDFRLYKVVFKCRKYEQKDSNYYKFGGWEYSYEE